MRRIVIAALLACMVLPIPAQPMGYYCFEKVKPAACLYSDGQKRLLALKDHLQDSATAQRDTSATIILKNISHSNFAYCVAVVRGHIISTRNLRPGKSQSFTVPLPGTSLYRFKISLDPEEEYTYSIEPIDYFSQVSSEEIGPGTYEYLIDYDKKQDVMSVKLVKTN